VYESSMANKENILVVDDDPEIVSLLRRGLIYEGYNVVQVKKPSRKPGKMSRTWLSWML
jgi:DNA-binding response OmpR family regulator